MAITAAQVPAEILAARAIGGDVKSILLFLGEVTEIIEDAPPVWNEVDLTTQQRDALLAKYDAMKAALKVRVAAY